jgi:hypothetical protein
MMRNLIRNCLVVGLVGVGSAHGADGPGNPEALASKVATAFKAGDMDAALALYDTHHDQSLYRRSYMTLVLDCFEEFSCTISPGPLDEELKKELAKSDSERELDFDPTPEGQMNIIKKPSIGESHESNEWLPYAKVDGTYKITGGLVTKAWRAKHQGLTAQSITDEMLAKGPYLPGGRDPAWKGKASVLPPGGGEAGAALIARVKAMTAAAKANDVSAMVAAMGALGKYTYAEKDRDDKPVSLRRRQLLMRVEMMNELTDVTVLGGYQLNDFAVLVIEGHEGDGWVVRGWKAAHRQNGKWDWGGAGAGTIEFPPDMGP